MRQHPQFNSRSLAYNVAVLKLAGEPEEEVDSIAVKVFVEFDIYRVSFTLLKLKYGKPR